MRILILVLLLIGCSRGLTNRLDEKRFDCGDGYEAGKDYIKVSGADQLVSFPKDLKTTSKGCIERPKQGEVLVTNLSRSSGVWLNPQSRNEVNLEPMKASPLPSACNSVVHGDGRGFTLTVDFSATEKLQELQSIDVQLLTASGEKVTSWPTRPLAQTLAFAFDEAHPVLDGEYRLQASVNDGMTGAQSNSECTLRIDYSDLLISPAESIKTKRTYNGQEVLLVQPGYNVNFYVHEGFRDVSIEYCLKRILISEIGPKMNADIFRCDTTQDFLSTKSPSLDQGFWILNFRGQRGLVQNGWQHSIFAVDKTCFGSFKDPKDLKDLGCTTIRGSLEVNGYFTTENAHILDSIGMIYGNLTLDSAWTTDGFTLMPNLQEVYGNMDMEFGCEDSKLVPNLHTVWGNFSYESGSYTKCSLTGLTHISGDLTLQNLKDDSTDGIIPNIQLVEGKILLKDSTLTLPMFSQLQYAGGLTLSGNFPIENLDDFKSLRKVDYLELDELPNLTTLRTSRDLEIGYFKSSQLLKFASFSVGPSKISVTGGMSLGESALKDLKGVAFSEKLTILECTANSIVSLEGMENVKEISTFNMSYDYPMLNLKGLENIRKFNHLDIKWSGISDLNDLKSIEEIEELTLTNSGTIDLSALGNLKKSTIIQLNKYDEISFATLTNDLEATIALNEVSIENLDFLNPHIRLRRLSLTEMPKLKNLSGFENVHDLTGDLEIANAPHLTSLSGIQDLNIGGKLLLGITYNETEDSINSAQKGNLPLLTSFDELKNVTGVFGNAAIRVDSCIPKEIVDKLTLVVKGNAVRTESLDLFENPDHGRFYIKQPDKCSEL